VKSWGIYLSVVALLLFALGIGGLNILYRWRVKPYLSRQLAIQEKFHKPYEEDTAFLKEAAARLGYNSSATESDASFVLNPKVFWNPPLKGSKLGLGHPLVDEKLKIDIALAKDQWMTFVAKGRALGGDLSIFKDLSTYDHWDIERESPISELAAKQTFVPPTRLPIPDVSDLTTVVKLRLIDGGLRRDFLPALRDVRALAQLMMTTENLQLVLSGIVMLDHERQAFDYYAKELKWQTTEWMPVDREITRRAHRAVLATRGYLRLWTKPSRLQAYFLGDTTPVGFCAAVNEALPFDYALRRVLEPQLPFEMSTQEEYARLDRILLKARTKCRLRYLTKLSERGRFHVPVPGPFLLSHLPYSRKIFGMRVSASELGGFTDYARRSE
jgi:hypothetical protein